MFGCPFAGRFAQCPQCYSRYKITCKIARCPFAGCFRAFMSAMQSIRTLLLSVPAQNGADTVSRSCARSWTQTVRLLTSHTESLVCVDCRHPSAVTLETRKAFGGDFAARELQQKHGASRHPNQLRKFARLCTHRSVAISYYHSHCRALASPAVASIWSLSAFCLPSLHAHHTSRAQCVTAPVACKK